MNSPFVFKMVAWEVRPPNSSARQHFGDAPALAGFLSNIYFRRVEVMAHI
jgi:hypothetical protein